MKVNLPKKALERVQLGQSFAEYDIVRQDPSIFVVTPASLVAFDPENPKSIFVGRRGSGKTAIAYQILAKNRRAVAVSPQIFDLIKLPESLDKFKDTRQRPFKSLVCVFERALLGELLKQWVARHIWSFGDEFPAASKDRGLVENCDFDSRVLNLVSEVFESYRNPNEKLWLRQIKRAQEMVEEVNAARIDSNFDSAFIIDRLDDAWDGSDAAVISLMALMHCCVHLRAVCRCLRPYLFIRENIYSRIRLIDNEFSRIETSLVFLEWTREKLVELVERRLVRPFSTKPALGGEAWDHFFEEDGFDSQEQIFSFCETRPRDVLTYVSFALEAAVAHGRTKITKAEILQARDRFSTSKLKDLADEFAENFPNIHLILELFYGLSTDYSLVAIENFIEKLMVDRRIAENCGSWFFDVVSPHRFIELFFNIGFLGVREGSKWTFKAGAGDSACLPAIQKSSVFRIHPSFHAALHLRETMLTEISNEIILQHEGILEELPTGVSFDGYQDKLKMLVNDLAGLPCGKADAKRYEDIIGDVVKLCFFRALTNVQPKERSADGAVIRDWIASNRASGGFWAVIRDKYKATQVIWECKNYEKLTADDFHQASYYMNHASGRFVVIAFRGQEVEVGYYKHLNRIAQEKDGMVLLLTEKDLKVFLRQAINGKAREDHLNEVYDKQVRAIS